MNKQDELAKQARLTAGILKSMDIAVLQWLAPRQYAALGEIPPFYNKLFPQDENGPCLNPWKHSFMLEAFFEDVEEFFLHADSGGLSSGVWQEDSLPEPEWPLLAKALILDGSKLVLIRQLKEDYASHLDILRKAREQLLERRNLTRDLRALRDKSQMDSLTKVFNRATFMELLQEEIRRATTAWTTVSLALIDIDKFKHINDTYGHLAGDLVLAGMGQIFQDNLRHEDVIARFGGDEFIMFAPSTLEEQILHIAEKLRAAVAQQVFGNLPRVTLSIGCASYIPGESIENLIQRADSALYEVKRTGRNAIRFF